MAKMKLNMIALHNYGQSLVQPTVWTGLETDFDHATGRLEKNGSYYAGYITTSGGATWGGVPMNISDYLFGAQNAFVLRQGIRGEHVLRRYPVANASRFPSPNPNAKLTGLAQILGQLQTSMNRDSHSNLCANK